MLSQLLVASGVSVVCGGLGLTEWLRSRGARVMGVRRTAFAHGSGLTPGSGVTRGSVLGRGASPTGGSSLTGGFGLAQGSGARALPTPVRLPAGEAIPMYERVTRLTVLTGIRQSVRDEDDDYLWSLARR